MDRRLPPAPRWRRWGQRWWQRWWQTGAAAAFALAVLAALAAQRGHRQPTVNAPQLATVQAGEFRDELALRARVEPLASVQLDAVEAGRVEAVLARDGDVLAAGAPLYRLRSPEQEQLLMQRSAEVAQQASNVSAQRSALAASMAANRRELAQLQSAEQQATSELQRQDALAAAGFVSASALEQARRQHSLAQQLLQQAQHDMQLEAGIRQQSITELSAALMGLQRGLRLLEGSRDRLLQRAPIGGQLSGFNLQVGTSVRPGDRLGRIDDSSSGVQLAADVDEYYLPRLQPGQLASSPAGTLSLAQTLPQIQGGKVRALLRWPTGQMPQTLRPGQAVDVRLQFSAPHAALLLPEGPGVQPSLYVRNNQGPELRRRSVQLGRRAAGQVEILAGLQAGDEVLISLPPSNEERLFLP